MVRVVVAFVFALIVSASAGAGNWNNGSGEFQYENDFSRSIYHNGASMNPTGKHSKAAKRQDDKLVVTLEAGMLDSHSKKTGRFELEKNGISPSLAVYQRYKMRSVNNDINDRLMVSQIKQYSKTGAGIPIAAVFLDRPPICATYSQDQQYPLKDSNVDDDERNGITSKKWLWTEKMKGWYVHSWQSHRFYNRPWKTLADNGWHIVEMDAYPHKSQGYCIIKIDGKIWMDVRNAPTKSFGSGDKMRDYAARIGIYRDAVNFSHTVEFDDWTVVAYDPSKGLHIEK
jgi:hypothetical protein